MSGSAAARGEAGLPPTNAAYEYARWAFRGYVGAVPWLYLPFERYNRGRQGLGSLVVSPSTDLVVEGYPRCGNTFAAHAFMYAQERPVSVAFRCHAPAQIIYAARHGIPALLLIREPFDAVCSSFIHAHGGLSLGFLLRQYAFFYTVLRPVAEQVTVADFATVTSDFGAVIEALNRRYGRNFRRLEHTPEVESAIFEHIHEFQRSTFYKGGEVDPARLSAPVATRRAGKGQIRATIEGRAALALRLEACRRVYRTFAGLAV